VIGVSALKMSSGTNACKAKIPEVINIKCMPDANGFVFLSMSLGLDFFEMLITAFLNRRQYITTSRKRRL